MSSINIIEKAKELKVLLENVIKDNPQLPPNPQKYMADTVMHAGALIEKLEHISDNWVQLTNLATQEKAMQGNVQFWDSIPPGAIDGDAVLDLVKNHSTTCGFRRNRTRISENIRTAVSGSIRTLSGAERRCARRCNSVSELRSSF